MGTAKRTRASNLKRMAPNTEALNLSCPQHDVNYVLRHNRRMDPMLSIYECPIDGCLNTYQERVKQ